MNDNTSGWTEEKTEQVYIELDSQSKVSYYLSKKTDPANAANVKYELHGNCWAWGVDISSWVAGTSKFTCDMGLYYDASTKVDWQSIEMLY